MIDDIKEYLKEIPENQKLNYLREYMQQIILKIISDTGYKNCITFTGGTALRIVYSIDRFSEVMDFSLRDKKNYNFNVLLDKLNKNLDKYGLKFEFKKIKQDIVNSFFIRFMDLLYPLKLSLQKEQKLSIKVDIDTNPPKGGSIKEFIFNNRFYFLTNHFNRESLFALKLHAFLFRNYTKGRDFYDLVYFLNKKVVPEFELFKNAVKQTNPKQKISNLQELFSMVEKKIKETVFKKVLDDIMPFLLKSEELKLVEKKNILLFLNQYLETII